MSWTNKEVLDHMRKVEDECVGCTNIGLYCIGSSCPNRNVPHYYCDRCGNEDKLYCYDGEELCEECLLKEFEVVDGSDL